MEINSIYKVIILGLLVNAFVGAILIMVRHYFVKPALKDDSWPTLWRDGGILGKTGIILLALSISTPIFLAMAVCGLVLFGFAYLMDVIVSFFYWCFDDDCDNDDYEDEDYYRDEKDDDEE